MKYSVKTQSYLDRLFEKQDPMKVEHFAFGYLWAFLPYLTLGLVAWGMFLGGPPVALSSAFAFVWAFIVVDMLMVMLMGLVNVAKTIFGNISRTDGDRAIFLHPKQKINRFFKFNSVVDTWLMLGASVCAGWTVSIIILVVLLLSENCVRLFGRSLRTERAKQIDLMTDEEIEELFEAEEAVKQKAASLKSDDESWRWN